MLSLSELDNEIEDGLACNEIDQLDWILDQYKNENNNSGRILISIKEKPNFTNFFCFTCFKPQRVWIGIGVRVGYIHVYYYLAYKMQFLLEIISSSLRFKFHFKI